MAHKHSAVVPDIMGGERIDKVLAALIPGMSRHLARKVLAMGGVFVGKRRVRMASFSVRAGETVQAVWHPDVLEPERFELAVVYEDQDLVVVDKPSGQLSQGSELGDVGSLIYSLSRRYGPEVRLMHRLDKGASGLLIAAKNPDTSGWLTPLFREHRLERRYLAIVSGAPTDGAIEVPIFHEGRIARAARPGEDGLPARSVVTTLERFGAESLVSVELFTGRTHQIRIHLSSVGCPIVGDAEYGGREAPRLALHAAVLGIERPDTAPLRLERAPPADFAACRRTPEVSP